MSCHYCGCNLAPHEDFMCDTCVYIAELYRVFNFADVTTDEVPAVFPLQWKALEQWSGTYSAACEAYIFDGSCHEIAEIAGQRMTALMEELRPCS
jgi:hypothetical protein